MAISMKFRPGKDDDIQQWWENDPARNYFLRKWIREGLKTRDNKSPVSVESILPEIPLEIKSLRVLDEEPSEPTGTGDILGQFD